MHSYVTALNSTTRWILLDIEKSATSKLERRLVLLHDDFEEPSTDSLVLLIDFFCPAHRAWVDFWLEETQHLLNLNNLYYSKSGFHFYKYTYRQNDS